MLLGVAAYSVLSALLLLRLPLGSSSGLQETMQDTRLDQHSSLEPSVQMVHQTTSENERVSSPVTRTKTAVTQHPETPIPLATLQLREKCWRANYSSPDRRPVDHTPRSFLLGDEAALCRGDIFLLVFVHSAVPNRPRRDLIRSTWASVGNIGGDRLKTLFFVGQTKDPAQAAELRRESEGRADIVQADFVDTYRNLTYKHLYALKWITEKCRSVRYVMKVDDDVMVNVFRLRESLREQVGERKGDFFYCKVSEVVPIRNREIKWFVTYEEYPDDSYPPYCKGFGYVMTGSLVDKLHRCAKWRRPFWIDDVFVSGDLASALGADRVNWADGWGAQRLHPRLAGPEAGQLVVAYGAENLVAPTLHRRIWRAIVRFSDWGWEN